MSTPATLPTNQGKSITKRFIAIVQSIRWMSLVLIFLGMLMVNQFFSQLGHGHFSANGFASYVRELASKGNIDFVTKWALAFIAEKSTWFAPLLAVFVAVTGLALMLLFARPVAAFLVSLFFWLLWYVTSSTTAIWAFEYFFPAAFALIAGLATLPEFISASGSNKCFGAQVLGSLRLSLWIALSIGISVLLAWFFILSRGGGQPDYVAVALYSLAAYIILLIATGVIDRFRQAQPPTPHGGMLLLAKLPWFDILIIVIGAMMCIQVFADIQVGWFTVEGYRKVIRSYAETTGAPNWWKSFLYFSSDHAAFLMPIQAIGEFLCAFFLVTLLMRPVTLLAAFGFFSMMMFSEFGILPNLTTGTEMTWEWEMIFVTGVTLMLAIATLPEILGKKDWQERILGNRFYSVHMGWRFLVAAICAVFLWGVGIQSKMFGVGYETISWRGGLFFFGCMVALAIIDKWRRPCNNMSA